MKQVSSALPDWRRPPALPRLQSDTDFVLGFDLVVTCNVDRIVEETLGEVLYHHPKKYLIISRASGFNVKLRSQYREHIVGDEGGQILHGIDLHPHPEPVTDEKADRVLQALSTSVDISSPTLQAFYLLITASSKVFRDIHGFVPGSGRAAVYLAGHEEDVMAEATAIASRRGLSVQLNEDDLRVCCEKGWSELHLTSKVLGAMMSLEGTKLLQSTGRPVNACLFGMIAQVALGDAVELEA
ncbi:hypothetical protein EHS25_001341 [Saitozyma podzolica]|uniref:Uncharacterized protein n=1 Tax=Saitozyma podzolica TaxID=1890683 RepID=A0A427YFY4_9TREE|nr:hypothetical protein EHS25_001341 [Saitozyma podzolica]